MVQIRIENIIVPKGRRPLDRAKVAEIAESFKLLGQLAPIGLRRLGNASAETSFERIKKIELVFGEHRLEAAKELGWEKIDAVEIRSKLLVPKGCMETWDDYTKLVEITENLHRAELTTQQRNEHLAAWVELYNRNTPQPNSGSGGSNSKPGPKPDPGVIAAAKMSGLTRNDVKRAIKTTKVSPAVKAAADRAELSQKLRLAISRMRTEAEQLAAIEATYNRHFVPPDTRAPTDAGKYADVAEHRATFDQFEVFLKVFAALEARGDAAQVAEAILLLNVDEDTVTRLRWVAAFATKVASIMSSKSKSIAAAE
jgi:hypothetical protein